MGDYGIDINVNMGGAGGNFQTLIDSINALNASFQKVGASGASAGSKTKQSFSDSMAIMAQYGNSVKNVEKEIARLKKEIIEQNNALKQKRITEAEHKASVDASSASLRQMTTALRNYNQLIGRTVASTKMASSGINMLTASFNKLGAVMGVSFGLYGVFRVLTNVVKTIADFDLAQKKLQSILGETKQGMEELSKSAITLGRNSIFGAKGVSELQIELAKMGFTKNEIMAMQGAINDLAIATQEDLASSAETVANIIKTYGLTATETRDVVNVMGKAFNDSALGLSNFRESIKYVAPVANQAGLSFRETVAALELLSNAGLKGSLAGTGLNNVLKAMMDSNSKLAKQMGSTVTGWEGFTSVLQRAREEGWNMQDVFGLITQRATGAFSTFMEGLPTLDAMAEKLQDVSNIMRDQMLVQMDSISYQAKLTKASWETLILSFDEGDNVISNLIKSSLKGMQKWMILISGSRGEISKSLVDQTIAVTEALSLEGLDEKTKKQLNKYKYLLQDEAQQASTKSANWIGNNLQIINNLLSASDELLSSTIVEGANKRIKALKIEGETYKEFEGARNAAILTINAEMTVLEAAGKKNTIQYKVLLEAIEKIDKLRFTRQYEDNENTQEAEKREKARLKAIKDRYDYELMMMKLMQQNVENEIKLRTEGHVQEYLLADSGLKFKKIFIEMERKMNLELGEDKVQINEEANRKMLISDQEYALEVMKISKQIDDEVLKDTESILDDIEKKTKETVDETVKYILEGYEKAMTDDATIRKFKKENPIINAIFGKSLFEKKGGMFSFKGLIDKEGLDDITKSLDETFSKIGESISSYADSWVELTDRIVEQLNRQVDETQSALDTEVELMTAGYANNVSLKRKELEELKKQRTQALKDQEVAQNAQVALDTVTQISSMITATTQLFKALSPLGPFGIAAAIALTSVMYGAYAASKAMAIKAAGVNKYEKGGWIGGRRHSEGGTPIEAEKGEFMINRKSAVKYKNLIEAVNDDNKIELNRIYLNGLKGNIIRASVSLDDSKDLKAIRKVLETKGKDIEYSNGYRIERHGNITTKTKIYLN